MKFLKPQSCFRMFAPFSLACILAAGCSGKSAPKKPDVLILPPPSALNNSVIGQMSAVGTEVMQKTVARIVGFVDIDGKTVNIYQDAYSVLYSTQQIQKGKDINVEADPIYYYTPIFSAQLPDLSQLPTRELSITIKNRETPEFVRNAIKRKAEESLKTYNIKAESINLVPLAKVSGKLSAFGKDYAVTVANDLSSLTLKIPLAEIPASLFSGTGSQTTVDAAKFNAAFTASSTLSITYNYYVQQFDNTTCGLQIDSDYVNKMFTDPEKKCPATPAPDLTQPSMKALKDPSSALAQNPKFQGLDQLTTAINRQVIGACLAAVESQKLTARSSVRCVKPGGKEMSEDLKNFLSKVIVPIASVVASNYTAEYSNWSKDMMTAAIKLFGSPEKFASEMTKFNDQFLNQNEKEKRDIYLKDNSSVIATINDHATKKEATSGSSSNGGFGVSAGFGGVSIGLNSANGNSKFDTSIEEAVNTLHVSTDKKDVDSANNYLKEKGLNHQIANSQGKFMFYPSISINMSADVKEIKDNSSSMTTIDLGKVVSVEETTSAVLKKRPEASLVIQVYCANAGESLNTNNAFTHTEYLTEAEWWRDPRFFEEISKDVLDKMQGLTCGQMAFGGYFTGIMEANGKLVSENSDLLPPNGISINARVQGAGLNPTTKLPQTESQLSTVVLSPGHTIGMPLIGTSLTVSQSGQAAGIKFSTIKISK